MTNNTCVGKYIILFQDVIITFLSVSIVFIIMITGFAFGFHILLSNRDEFATPYDATLKAFMMMSGICIKHISYKIIICICMHTCCPKSIRLTVLQDYDLR